MDRLDQTRKLDQWSSQSYCSILKLNRPIKEGSVTPMGPEFGRVAWRESDLRDPIRPIDILTHL